MNSHPLPLRHTLGVLVALAGVEGCADNCPHTVIDRQSMVTLTTNQACVLVQHPLFASGRNFEGFTAAQCVASCNDTAVNVCTLRTGYEQAFGEANPGFDFVRGVRPDGTATVCPPWSAADTLVLTCQVTHVEGTATSGCPVPGRRPAGLAHSDVSMDASTLGAYFARCAHFEAASVVAFELLGAELAAHGAPESLIRATALAGAQEVRHAELMGALATRFGALTQAPKVDRGNVRSLVEIARENMVEGVVRETFAAAHALWCSEHAGDPEVKRAMCEIADDECAHATLSWEVAAWASSRLSDSDRSALAVEAREAIHALIAGTARDRASEILCDVAGVPDSAASARIVKLLDAEVWSRSPMMREGQLTVS
jgi:hypothetical protein